mmetsp:Transcript_19630/g.17822  ORF Transcript_19630/g.17822 Transcript_19630/m.17822 type:complete len:559 (+) Transcript_19630:328-2004(+)
MWYSLSISPSGEFIYATDNNNKQIYKYTNQSAQSELISSQKDYFLTRIASSNSESYIYVTVRRGYIYKLDALIDNRSMIYKKLALWTGISSSANGVYIYAVEETGHIHISNNYGLLNSWSVYSPIEGLWSSITSSITGEVVIAVDKLGTVVRSIDYGVTWESFSTSLKSKMLTSVAVTNDIYNIVYVTAYNNHIYTLQDPNRPTSSPTISPTTISPTTSNPTAVPTTVVVDLNVNLFNNIDFNIPAIETNQYQFFEETYGGWFLSATINNGETGFGISFPYPFGDQCVILQNTFYIYQNVSLVQYYTYNLTWFACGREYNVGSNTVDIILQNVISEEVVALNTFTPPTAIWTSYSITFSPIATSEYLIYFQGKLDNSIGDASTAIQHIQIESISSPYVTITIVNALFGTSYHINDGIDVTSTVQSLVNTQLSFDISTATLGNPSLDGQLSLWITYIVDDGTEISIWPAYAGSIVIINRSNQPLTIISAWFGSQQNVLGASVTSTVQSLLVEHFSIGANVGNFGDPQGGMYKYLWVTYSYFDGVQNTVSTGEGSYLYII